MMRFLANLLSYIFHPVILVLLMPYLFIYRQTGSDLYALKWEIFSSLFIFFGVVLVFLGRRRGVFKERYEFYTLLWILAFLYLAAASFLKGIFSPLSIVALGIALGILVFIIVNRYIKASIHMAVVCAWVVSMGILYGRGAFLVTFWMVPLVLWARVASKNHLLNEALLGGVLGVVITLLTFLIGRQLLL